MQASWDALADDFAAITGSLLRPAAPDALHALDLFAGCGGLALGFEANGFATYGFERDADCCATYTGNLHGPCTRMVLTPATQLPPADVIIGGPPCQPFSVGGLQRGHVDERNGFPAFVAAVAQVRPRLWLLENVRGVFYRNRNYVEGVLAELEGLGYRVDVQLVNAVGHGVPQNRERVIAVGHSGGFAFPAPLPRRVSAGEALRALQPEECAEPRFLTTSMDAYIERYELASKCVVPRDLHLDRPARTLTTRNLAGATGDMHRLRLPDGRRRRLTVREAARLQSFPDWFRFTGSENSQFGQIGNAVPPLLAYRLAGAVRKCLLAEHVASARESNPDSRALPGRHAPVTEAVPE